jgi:hypothetical protein
MRTDNLASRRTKINNARGLSRLSPSEIVASHTRNTRPTTSSLSVARPSCASALPISAGGCYGGAGASADSRDASHRSMRHRAMHHRSCPTGARGRGGEGEGNDEGISLLASIRRANSRSSRIRAASASFGVDPRLRCKERRKEEGREERGPEGGGARQRCVSRSRCNGRA